MVIEGHLHLRYNQSYSLFNIFGDGSYLGSCGKSTTARMQSPKYKNIYKSSSFGCLDN